MESGVSIIVGVDTHADVHVGVALDHLGRRLGEVVLQNEIAGYGGLLEWALNLGELACVGVEGTGSFGAGLSRWNRELWGRTVALLEISGCARGRGQPHKPPAPPSARQV